MYRLSAFYLFSFGSEDPSLLASKMSALDSVSPPRPSGSNDGQSHGMSNGQSNGGMSNGGQSQVQGNGNGAVGPVGASVPRSAQESTGVILPCIGCGASPPASFDHVNRNANINQFHQNLGATSQQHLPTTQQYLPTAQQHLPTAPQQQHLPTSQQHLPTSQQHLPASQQHLPTSQQHLPTSQPMRHPFVTASQQPYQVASAVNNNNVMYVNRLGAPSSAKQQRETIGAECARDQVGGSR